jgi:hypothetical protein
LFALPNTQLQRRLEKEGRLGEGFEVAPGDAADQCSAGLNFVTKRPRIDVLRDYRRIIDESYAPEAYFGRVLEVGTKLNCSKKKLKLPLRHTLRDLRTFSRLLYHLGVRKSYRGHFWRTLAKLAWRNPRGLRYSVALLALYLHFGDFRKFLVARLGDEIRALEQPDAAQPDPAARRLAV